MPKRTRVPRSRPCRGTVFSVANARRGEKSISFGRTIINSVRLPGDNFIAGQTEVNRTDLPAQLITGSQRQSRCVARYTA